MDSTRPPGVRVDSILLDGFSFRKKEDLDVRKPYNVNVGLVNKTGLVEGEKQGILRSHVTIEEQSDHLFEITLDYSLVATAIEGAENMPVRDFLETSAPALLYQFARETVLTMTQKAGIPLILPPMNLTKIDE